MGGERDLTLGRGRIPVPPPPPPFWMKPWLFFHYHTKGSLELYSTIYNHFSDCMCACVHIRNGVAVCKAPKAKTAAFEMPCQNWTTNTHYQTHNMSRTRTLLIWPNFLQLMYTLPSSVPQRKVFSLIAMAEWVVLLCVCVCVFVCVCVCVCVYVCVCVWTEFHEIRLSACVPDLWYS